MFLASAVTTVFPAAPILGRVVRDDSLTQPPPPDLSVGAAYAIDVSADVELYAINADERRAPASLTKMATAIVVVDNADLDRQIEIDPSDLVDEEQSRMNLVAGDVLTVEQLLYGLLLPSGNDAANALARALGADFLKRADDPTAQRAAFVDAMNDAVESLGLRDTHFMNPTGLDAPDHYSTARELAILAAAALDDDVLASIMATPSVSLTSVGPQPIQYDLLTSNELLAEDGIHGVKTGTTEAAGGCLVTAAWFHGPNRVITVVLGSAVAYDELGNKTVDARFNDTLVLLDALQTDYRWISPTDPDDMPDLAEELAAWEVTLKPGPAIVVPAADLPRFHYRVRLGPAGPPDSEVGSVVFFVGSVTVAKRPLYQASQDEDASALAPVARAS